jgi:flagellar hook-associated protein 1 FlgK
MAGTITSALRTAQSGLLANQAALDAVANNIANVSTVGYSRKVVNMESVVVNGSGTGVRLAELTRSIDEGLLKSLRSENGILNLYSAQTSFFERMQDMFGSPAQNSSISHIMAGLGETMQSLALGPNQAIDQSELIRQADALMTKFHGMVDTIQELRKEADVGISDTVQEINTLTTSLGDLNDKIVQNSTSGLDVSDLKDKRDQGLDALSKLIDIRYFYRADGDVVVFTSAGRTIVDNIPAVLSHTAASSLTPTSTHAEGDINGIYVGTPVKGNDITNDLRSGRLKGLVIIRDEILTNLQSQLDELAAELQQKINQVHNQGTTFPGIRAMSGTRIFIAPATQTIRLDPTNNTGDVNISLFDNDGNQSATTTLNTIMQSATYGSALSSRGASNDWTINEVATSMQAWLQANGAETATVSAITGKMEISLNSTSLNLGFRDQSASANGSSVSDVEIAFDANGDNVTDETKSGFSNFFGLNDFFVDSLADNVHESDVISSSFAASDATLTIRDASGLLGTTVSIATGDNIFTVATKINLAVSGVTATIVPDGSGNRLRISHDSGASITVTQASSNSLLTTLGMHIADVRISATLEVRSDIKLTPAKISSGSVQWDSTLGTSGEYLTSVSDNSTATALAKAMTSTNSFDTSGGIGGGDMTFEKHAAAILSLNATNSNDNAADRNYQENLTESLQLKSDSVRGVNLDEELSNLIVFEQSYSAAARLISVIQRMFDALDRAMGG